MNAFHAAARCCAATLAIAFASAAAAEPLPAQGEVTFRPTAAEARLPAEFRLEDHRFAYRAKARPNRLDSVPSWDVSFPSPVATPHPNNNRVACEYFPPLREGAQPGVVVLHILGGDFELSRLCCRALARAGCGALFVKLPYYGPRRQPGESRRMISVDPRETVEGMRQGVLDIRRGAAWLAARPEIDEARLGIFGISLGGIVGGLAAGVEPRFEKVCLVLAGGDVARVAWESPELEKVRRRWKLSGLTRAEATRLLTLVDPVTYAPRLRDRQVLMINARHDEVIPRACTDALWDALGRPEIVWWNAGHYTAALYLPGGIARMTAFFAPATAETARQPVR